MVYRTIVALLLALCLVGAPVVNMTTGNTAQVIDLQAEPVNPVVLPVVGPPTRRYRRAERDLHSAVTPILNHKGWGALKWAAVLMAAGVVICGVVLANTYEAAVPGLVLAMAAVGLPETQPEDKAAARKANLDRMVKEMMAKLPANIPQEQIVLEDVPVITHHRRQDPLPRTMLQAYTVIAEWDGCDEQAERPVGLHAQALPPGEVPKDKTLARAFAGQWSVRIPYENARVKYALFLCRNALELMSVLTETTDGLDINGATYHPAYTLFSDKGCHIVFTAQRMGPANWLRLLGYAVPEKTFSRGDLFWKFVKRYRRSVSVCDVYFRPEVVEGPVQDFEGVKGTTWYRYRSPITNKTFTVLYVPVAYGKDGQDVEGYGSSKDADWTMDGGSECEPWAWDLAIGEHIGALKGVSLRGCLPLGTLKGHMRVNTPNKQLAADFIISDVKNEMMAEHHEMGILFHLHKYAGARTDAQSVVHFAFEQFLPFWAKERLAYLKAALTNTEKAEAWLGEEIDESEETDWAVAELKRSLSQHDVKWAWNRVPYFFRAITNAVVASFKWFTSAENDRHKVAIPLPNDLFKRRYVMLWEDATDRYGRPTNSNDHLLQRGEALMGDGWVGKVAAWRQPNGTPKDFNFYALVSPLTHFTLFVTRYDEFEKALNASPFIFMGAPSNKEILAVNGGMDFDDTQIIGRGDTIVKHFEWLSTLQYPEGRDEFLKPKMAYTINGHTELTWPFLCELAEGILGSDGIGAFVNPLMVFNLYWRLAVMDPQRWGFLLAGVTAPMQVLGRELEVVIDSFAKFGGIGLGEYRKLIADFKNQVGYTSWALAWKDNGTGFYPYGGRLGGKKTSKLIENNRIVALPLDEALADVRAQVEEFKTWVEATFKILPTTWGLDPILWQLDYVPLADGIMQKIVALWEMYRAHFTVRGDHKTEMKSAQTWWGGFLQSCTYKDQLWLMTALFQFVYSNQPSQEKDRRYRFFGEDLLWESGALETMFGIAIPYAHEPKEPGKLPASITFSVFMNDASKKFADAWRKLGEEGREASVRIVNGLPMVFVTGKNGSEVEIGCSFDRHIARACALGEVKVKLQPRSNASLQATFVTAQNTCPPPQKTEKAKQSVEEREQAWKQVEGRFAAALSQPLAMAAAAGAETSVTVDVPDVPVNIFKRVAESVPVNQPVKEEGISLIVAGSRSVTDFALVCRILDSIKSPIKEVISGTARGVDTMGEQWAQSKGIPVRRMPADWNRFGKSAGHRRNAEMAKVGTHLVAIWDGTSSGTKGMIDIMRAMGKPAWVPDLSKFGGPQAPMAAVANSKKLDWELLPPGMGKSHTFATLLERMNLAPEHKELLAERLTFLQSLFPTAEIWSGSGEFSKYFMVKVANDLVVLENCEYSNAAYVMYDNWETLSKLSRTQLYEMADKSGFIKIVHSGDWKTKLQEATKRQ